MTQSFGWLPVKYNALNFKVDAYAKQKFVSQKVENNRQVNEYILIFVYF